MRKAKQMVLNSGSTKESNVVHEASGKRFACSFSYEVDSHRNIQVKKWEISLGEQFEHTNPVLSIAFEKGEISSIRFMYQPNADDVNSGHPQPNGAHKLGKKTLNTYLIQDNNFCFAYSLQHSYPNYWWGIELPFPKKQTFSNLWYVDGPDAYSYKEADYKVGKLKETLGIPQLERLGVHSFSQKDNVFRSDVTHDMTNKHHEIPLQAYRNLIAELLSLVPIVPLAPTTI